MTHLSPSKQLLEWFLASRRRLPWRENPTPYAVLVSEVMLQQTRVEVVIPYFLRWMDAFPDFQSLAAAEESRVIKLWEGLGYYSRARNLRKAAQIIVTSHAGEMPECEYSLRKLPGVGRYTAAAVLAFAFHKRKIALDGNGMRVLARWKNFSEEIQREASFRQLEAFGETLLDRKEPWHSAEALIELGALICKPFNPLCEECPLKGSCIAFCNGTQEKLPVKRPPVPVEALQHAVIIAIDGDQLFIETPSQGERFEGLYHFPYFKQQEKNASPTAQFIEEASTHVGRLLYWERLLPTFRHSFTRYRAELTPHFFRVERRDTTERRISDAQGSWMAISALQELPFVAGHREILNYLLQSIEFFKSSDALPTGN